MGLFATLDRHTDLMTRMAARTGADLSGAILKGELSAAGMRGAVLRCTGCAEAERCARWLDMQVPAPAAVPDYCANSELMTRLQG